MSRVTVDRATGALRIGGAKACPLGLSDPPPLGSSAPNGVDSLKEIAGAGATFIRTGLGDWGPNRLDEQLAAERAVLDAAAQGRQVFRSVAAAGGGCRDWLGPHDARAYRFAL